VRAAIPVGLGLLWAAVVVAAVTASSLLTVAVMEPVAVVATVSGFRASRPARPARARRRARNRPPVALVAAVAMCLMVPLVALAGPYAATAGLTVGGGAVAALVLSTGFATSARPVRPVAAQLYAGLAPMVAVTSVVVARHQGSSLALTLVAALFAYDVGAFVMGHGRTPSGGVAGVAFGMVSVAVVAIFTAAVLDPPFSASRPWVMFGAVAVLAALGVRLGGSVSGGERLPALRRLDSWSLAAPFWVLATALLLHR